MLRQRFESDTPPSAISLVTLTLSRFNRFVRYSTIPWDRKSNGTWYTEETSWTPKTCSAATWQNIDILLFVSGRRGWGTRRRHAIRSGRRPNPRREWTVVWVGFVFCSPCMSGTRDTWIKAKFSWPTRNWNWRIASTNGADSMSPTVPPSYRNRRIRTWVGATKTYLDYADVRLFARFIYWNFRYTFDPVLNLIRDMRDDLKRYLNIR